MALAAQAALLDELMGKTRNMEPTDAMNSEIKFDDDEVCKHYLCGFCPHDLFFNTRVDLGECEKVHDDKLREDYKNSRSYQKLNYEKDYFRFMQSLVTEVDKRIRRGHMRLELNNSQVPPSPQVLKEEKLKSLSERIETLLSQAEELGCEGKVDEAQKIMQLVDELKEERTQTALTQPVQSALSEIKEMEVCSVCGAFTVKGDAPQRVEEHLNGRMHLGYAKIRAFVNDYEETKKKEMEEVREKDREERKSREEKLRSRDEDSTGRKDRDRRERRSRSRGERKRRSRSRERVRSRSRDRYQRREKSRERRRSRSHERHGRSSRESRHSRDGFDRDKERSRDHDRKNRDRERDRRGHDRHRGSRDRERNKYD